MNKKIILAVVLGVVLLGVGVAVVLSTFMIFDSDTTKDGNIQQVSGEAVNKEEKPSSPRENKNEAGQNKEEEKFTPTFMYFIEDADVKNTKDVLERLEKEYEGKVVFDIRNVSEDPELLDNFPVEGATPALIMLNTKNDISAFLFKNSNYEELKAEIEKALK